MNERIERNLAKQEGYFEGVDDGILTGIEQGIQQGTLKKEKEIVLNMYNQKYKIEDIVSITNLNRVEVESIIQENLNS